MLVPPEMSVEARGWKMSGSLGYGGRGDVEAMLASVCLGDLLTAAVSTVLPAWPSCHCVSMETDVCRPAKRDESLGACLLAS